MELRILRDLTVARKNQEARSTLSIRQNDRLRTGKTNSWLHVVRFFVSLLFLWGVTDPGMMEPYRGCEQLIPNSPTVQQQAEAGKRRSLKQAQFSASQLYPWKRRTGTPLAPGACTRSGRAAAEFAPAGADAAQGSSARHWQLEASDSCSAGPLTQACTVRTLIF